MDDNNSIGATWIWTRNSSNVWTQYGNKLVGSGYTGTSIYQGDYNSISLSSDGSVLFVGGYGDNSYVGAAWAFNNSAFAIPPNCPLPTSTPSTIYSCPSPIPNGTTCTPTCASTFTANASLAIYCNNGTLSTPLGMCNPNCATLFTLPTNAVAGTCTANYPSGGSCTIACGLTSSLSSGSLSATCTATGVWTPPTATCTPNPCSIPSDTSSTTFSSSCAASTPSGSSCTPLCANGYNASASLTITCSYGTFSSPAGTCQPNPCPRPTDTPATIYSIVSCPSPTSSGSVCTPSCQLGYSVTGGSIALTCLLGNFSTPTGSCTPNPCTRPSDSATTTYSSSCLSSTPSGSTCVPTCVNGYSQSGDLTITCTAGTFSSAAGVCNPSPCPRPADTSSTLFSQSSCPSPTPSGSACVPTCQSGYTATGGSLSRTCTLGNFSTPVGSCTPNPCSVPSDTASTTYSSCLASTPSGSACVPTCQNGYTATGGSLSITCNLGSFSTAAGTCDPSPCPSPILTVPNTTVGGCGASTPSSSTCVLGCAIGYVANGSLAVTCTLGNFSAPAGRCIISTSDVCSQPTPSLPLTPGDCPSALPNATQCTLGCTAGYGPQSGGLFNVTCINSDLTPIDPSAVCDENPCSLPLPLPTGMNEGTCASVQSGGSSCYFACDAGYTPSGVMNMTCTAGAYSSIQGSCNPNPCMQSAIPLSTGMTTGDCPALIPSDSSCTVSCSTGYGAGSGSVNVTCSLGSLVALPTLSCIPNPCSLPSFSAGMNQGSCSAVQPGNTSCYFACSTGYTLSLGGVLNVTCSAGAYSPVIGLCNPNPCPQPQVTFASALTVGNCQAQTISGDSCSLACIAGFTPFGTLTTTCTAGAFTPNGVGYCVGVANITTSSTSLPSLVASPGTVVTIALNRLLGNPPSDMAVSNYSVNGVFADGNYGMPDLGVQNETATLLVYVTSGSLGLTNALLSSFSASVQFYEAPVLKSVCPDSITAGIDVSVLVQGSGFISSSSLRCVLNGEYLYPAVYG